MSALRKLLDPCVSWFNYLSKREQTLEYVISLARVSNPDAFLKMVLKYEVRTRY